MRTLRSLRLLGTALPLYLAACGAPPPSQPSEPSSTSSPPGTPDPGPGQDPYGNPAPADPGTPNTPPPTMPGASGLTASFPVPVGTLRLNETKDFPLAITGGE